MESYSLEWLSQICEKCFGTVKHNILKTGSMDLVFEKRSDDAIKVRAQVKCANPESEVWSWPVESDFF